MNTMNKIYKDKRAEMMSNKLNFCGIGFGSALAITISWSINKSILWALLHGVFSWFYVGYYLFTK